MGDTSIQWTDATWNPVTGCSKVSPGCAHCYAERVAIRLWPSQYPPVLERVFRGDAPGPVSEMLTRPRQFTDVQCHEDRLDQPLRWKKPRKIFVNSMSDLFHEDVPDAFIDRVFAVMALAPQHTFQILTKRAERMREYITADDLTDRIDEASTEHGACHANLDPPRWPLPNVWLGVSVENQHFADARILLLLQTPAAIRFISAEPLLEAVNIEPFLWDEDDRHNALGALDWVIVGGESGTGARPFDVAWARSIVAQCQAAGVPVFVKQLGSHPVAEYDGLAEHPPGAMFDWITRDPKGGDMAEWPEDLRVREFPGVPA